MRLAPFLFAASAAVLGFAAAELAPAEDAPWHASLEKGVEAAKKSGRPVFLVTIWKTGV